MSIITKAGLIARLFILFILLSCSKNSEEKTVSSGLSLKLDTVSIRIEDYQLFDYPIASVLATNSTEFFYGYNSPLHRIDVFSLSEGKFLRSINLSLDGPNSLSSPFDFFVQSPDSIFFYGNDYSLDLVNENGVVFSKNLIPTTRDSSNAKRGFLSDPLSFNLYFDSKSRSIFFHSYSKEAIPNQTAYYQLPILTEIQLETDRFYDYPFYFPSEYLKPGQYLGEYMNPNIVVSDSLIIFSFPNSPSINIYDRKLEELKSKQVESRFTKNAVESMSSMTYSEMHLRLNHLIENPYFYKTVYDPYRNLFYRTHRGEHPNPDLNSGNLNFAQTRDYLTVMDENLNLLEEIELPTHKLDATSFFVTKEGLFFPFSHYLNEEVSEEKLVFHVYKFELN